MAFVLTARERRFLAWFVAAIVGIRLATLGAYPLMDTTEARYAEIARKMLETGDWLMPQFDYGVPFWGKPPLSTWLSAASMAIFGVNEFAARLPSLLLLVASGALVHALARMRGGRDQALWALALFASTALVFVAAGGVMTDPALVFGTTLSMAGFWVAVNGPGLTRRSAAIAFFGGLAVGLLAKGPVAVILVFVPTGAATLWTRSWRTAWQRLPWLAGGAMTLAATISWYWAAERASPGFLDYFLVGEHWNRFVHPGWAGDLYGSAHSRVRGMIWLFWIAAALPWSVDALGWIVRATTGGRHDARTLLTDPWRVYLLAWTLTPMLFFTPAGNILITYVLPGLPAFALLVADVWRPEANTRGEDAGARGVRFALRRVLAAGSAIPVLFLVGIVVLHASLDAERSQKALVRDYLQARSGTAARLVYLRERPHSAEFYSRGQAVKAADTAALRLLFAGATTNYFALRDRDLAALSEAERARLQPMGTYGDYRLLRAAPP